MLNYLDSFNLKKRSRRCNFVYIVLLIKITYLAITYLLRIGRQQMEKKIRSQYYICTIVNYNVGVVKIYIISSLLQSLKNYSTYLPTYLHTLKKRKAGVVVVNLELVGILRPVHLKLRHWRCTYVYST
jgi:hypothetical protein